MGIYHSFDHFVDVGEADVAFQEGVDRHFVGGAKDGGVGPATAGSVQGQVEAREALRFQGLELQ